MNKKIISSTNPLDIARSIVDISNEIDKPVDNIKLNLLIFLSQVKSLEKYDELLFSHVPMENYRFGPCCKIVYDEYKSNFDRPILENPKKLVRSFDKNYNIVTKTIKRDGINSMIVPPMQEEIIKEIILAYQDFSSWDLVDRIHNFMKQVDLSRHEKFTFSKQIYKKFI